MPIINVMIKPVSGNCNLRCTYCFYGDLVEHREIKSYGTMGMDTLENIVKKVLIEATESCTIAFQGGEPTLIGIDFYRNLMALQKQYNRKKIIIHNSIQTNGICIDEDWAKFLSENNFLVGLSVDGYKSLNDLYRIDENGFGSYEQIYRTTKLFDAYHVEYNILTVVTQQVADNIKDVYDFYKSQGWHYMQFIPCLDPFGEERGNHEYSLTVEGFGKFLCTLFDLWHTDAMNGEYTYIRYFENILGIFLGFYPESCGVSGICSKQYIIEADGGVYPCDFYVTEEYNIGNLNNDAFVDIEKNREKIGFIKMSENHEKMCSECKWLNLCRGGCRRDREGKNGIGLNFFCEAYKIFFANSFAGFNELAALSRKKHLDSM